MSFVKKVWFDPIRLDASNINRIEQGLKNSYDNIEIIKEEVLSLQLSNAKLNTKVNTLFSNSPKILEDISGIQTILSSNSAILETLKDTSHLLTKDKQLLTSEEIKQVQSNLGIDKFLHLTDIKLNGESIVSGSEVEIKLPSPDTELDPSSDNSLSNKAIAQALQELSKSIKYSDIIGTPTYKDIANNHNHNSLYASIDHMHLNYALANHDHDTKYASISHDHNNIYSLYNHIHNNYAKILHTHSNYAALIHNHDTEYSPISHTHTESQIIDLKAYALLNHTHDDRYPSLSHTHPMYATTQHTHPDISTELARLKEDVEDTINSLENSSNLATKDYVQKNGGKIDSISVNGETLEIENKNVDIIIPTSLSQLANTPGYISKIEAKEYTDTAISNLINGSKETLDTLSELADAIENNADIIEALDSAVTNKAEKNHTHTESQITDLKNYALATHKHTESDITNLKNYALSSHTHKESEITDLKDYALSNHTHVSTDISNLDAILANYSQSTHKHDDLYSKISHTHTESEITDLQNYALKGHTHATTEITGLDTKISTTLTDAKKYTDAQAEELSAVLTELSDAFDTHTHDYLPTSGGKLSGTVTMTGGDFIANYVAVKAATHETGEYDKIATLSSSSYIRYRTKEELASDLGVPTDYAKKAEGVYFVDGTDNTTAGTWEGTNDRITEYYDGLTVNFKIGIAGASTTTLNINGLGAKTCYLRGTTKVTTHYAVGTMVLFTYNATTDAFYSSDYDANTSVTQTVRTTSGNFPLLLRGTSPGTTTTTTTTTFGTKMTANPSTGNISAYSFTENGTLLSSKYATRTQLSSLTTQVSSLSNSVIKTVSTQYIRITDLTSGVYKLTYSGTKYIYYKGTTDTATVNLGSINDGTLILNVSKVSDTTWLWNVMYAGTSLWTNLPYMIYGITQESAGSTYTVYLNTIVDTMYSVTGTNTDGPMTQKATTDEFAKYLPLTGGTLTRPEGEAVSDCALYLKSNTFGSYIGFANSDKYLGFLGINSVGNPTFKTAPEDVSIPAEEFLLAFKSDFDSYLPLSGGQLVGRISFKDNNALPEASTMDFFLGIDSYATGGGIKYTNKEQAWVGTAGCAEYLKGFGFATTSQTWGNQTGTFICGMDDDTGGSLAFRKDNPTTGQLSMIIDGTVYVNEGQKEVATKEDIPTGLPLGAIFASTVPVTDSTVHLLDGSTISQTGMYAAFATYLKSLQSSYPNLFTTETNWQTIVTINGECGKFVIDDTAGTIRLPKIVNFIQGTVSLSTIGDAVAPGIPNITGKVGFTDDNGGMHYHVRVNTDHTNGAFYGTDNEGSTYKINSNGSQSAGGYNAAGFDASRSSSIYGASTTVQPRSILYPYYIVLATAVKTQTVINIDNVATDVNAKLAKTDIKRYPVDSYYTESTWWVVYNDGWKEAGGTANRDTNKAYGITFTNEPTLVLTYKYNSSNNITGSDTPIKITTSTAKSNFTWGTYHAYTTVACYYACGY